MPLYQVTVRHFIEETARVKVEADNEDEAKEIVAQMHADDEGDFDWSDEGSDETKDFEVLVVRRIQKVPC